MTKDVRREEMSEFALLHGCSYNEEICFDRIESKSIVCHTARYITNTTAFIFKAKLSVWCR